MIRHKFSPVINKEFSVVLRQRVSDYFKDLGLEQNANAEMITKTVVLLSLYIGAYFLMLLGGFTNLYVLFGLWLFLGLGKALIGMSVMHDNMHGSYSKKKWVNNLVGGLSTWTIGIDPEVWKIQHNVLHHTYTNIDHADEDIESRYIFRFTPHQPRRWFHKFQHFYAPVVYSLLSLIWIVAKDYMKLFNYKKKGLVKGGATFRKHIVNIVIRKTTYLAAFLLLPMWLLPYSVGMVLLMFVSMHAVTGLILSFVFQPAHVVPTSTFIMTDEQEIKENWQVHQLMTTSNFGMHNRLLTWLIGGLNYQVEHHLFPNICHVHYPKLSEIVKKTAEEFDLPYYAQRSFRAAVINHLIMLRDLGRKDQVQVAFTPAV
jgi:linoleoyl-CoA desaturase